MSAPTANGAAREAARRAGGGRTATRPSSAAQRHPVELYEAGLCGARLRAVSDDGDVLPLALERWLAPCTDADYTVLARAIGPVLDLGCGPGRHVAALASLGVFALGVDLSPLAITIARRRGAIAIEGSIFGHLPGAGQWASALLLDGNLGIGGDPATLLARVTELLAPGGHALVELAAARRSQVLRLRLESNALRSDAFPWAVVGSDDLENLAHAAGFAVRARWLADGRSFAMLHLRESAYVSR